MATTESVDKTLRSLAVSMLGDENIEDVFTGPDVTWQGDPAIRVTVLIRPGAVDRVGGARLAEGQVRLHDELDRLGEERFAIFRYMTREEFDTRDDPES